MAGGRAEALWRELLLCTSKRGAATTVGSQTRPDVVTPQEDILKTRARKNGWKWIVTRPNFIIGTSKVGRAKHNIFIGL